MLAPCSSHAASSSATVSPRPPFDVRRRPRWAAGAVEVARRHVGRTEDEVSDHVVHGPHLARRHRHVGHSVVDELADAQPASAVHPGEVDITHRRDVTAPATTVCRPSRQAGGLVGCWAPVPNVAPVLIRSAVADDRDALYDICLRTGDAGSDATALYRDPELIGAIWAGPYLALEPDLSFVAVGDEGVVGLRARRRRHGGVRGRVRAAVVARLAVAVARAERRRGGVGRREVDRKDPPPAGHAGDRPRRVPRPPAHQPAAEWAGPRCGWAIGGDAVRRAARPAASRVFTSASAVATNGRSASTSTSDSDRSPTPSMRPTPW